MPEPLIAGKYTVLRKLATGGMAEVFLARQQGLERFEKMVVLKRILPHLAEREEFVKMFLDEARTAADLRHANVVTVFDVGRDGGTYYIAMEYLHGQNLRRVQEAAIAGGGAMPLAASLRVVVDCARGLHHAHTKTDLAGRRLDIVHRDVSPQNAIVTYDGVTKIVDFGIAKAVGRSRETAPGIVKGKLEYMSPEQATGGEVGPRSDQFSLAIILYELTTGVRLFHRGTDFLTLKAVAECEVARPSSVVASYPKELEAIVLRALSRDPERRFHDCGEMADALESLPWRAATHGWVGEWMSSLFSKEREQEAVLLRATPPAGARTAFVPHPPTLATSAATRPLPSPVQATRIGTASATVASAPSAGGWIAPRAASRAILLSLYGLFVLHVFADEDGFFVVDYANRPMHLIASALGSILFGRWGALAGVYGVPLLPLALLAGAWLRRHVTSISLAAFWLGECLLNGAWYHSAPKFWLVSDDDNMGVMLGVPEAYLAIHSPAAALFLRVLGWAVLAGAAAVLVRPALLTEGRWGRVGPLG